jgi:hypothetical protein
MADNRDFMRVAKYCNAQFHDAMQKKVMCLIPPLAGARQLPFFRSHTPKER